MSIFQTQRIRDHHKVDWQEEYIVGMINHIGPMNAMRILTLCSKQKIMSPATAHKYLNTAAVKKLLSKKINVLDKREVEYSTTAKGERFLQDVVSVYKLRSLK